ncbi:MAG: hypothetical protein E5X09_23615, partial [Mesorhizobium sp.]
MSADKIGPNATRHLRHGMSHSVLLTAFRCAHYPSQEQEPTTWSYHQSEEPIMTNELDYLSRRVAAGKLSRRDFLGRAA